MTIALALLATAAGLCALAFWWIRRCNPAVAPAGSAQLRRVAPGCDVGQQLLMASADSATEGGGASGGAGGSAVRPQRRKPSGPSRRAFLRNSMAVGWLGVLGAFGGASLAFLWPSLRGGFGAQIEVDSEEDVLAFIRENRQPFVFPEGRCYFIEYDPARDRDGRYAELTNGSSIMAIYQVCPHLGCRVPFCESSQWFECPCHGSRYNGWGEYRFGPAPRGMDRFATSVNEDGRLVVDTSQVVEGPSRRVNSYDQPPEGPHCV